MAKLRLDTLRMDREAQAKGEAALFEVRNTNPEETQGFTRRHGSKIATDGSSISAPGITGRGDNSYYHLDADVGTDSFTIAMAVKAGNIGEQSGVGPVKGYHILAALRPEGDFLRTTNTGLPPNCWIVYITKTGATQEVGIAKTTAAGVIDSTQTSETSGSAIVDGTSFRLAAHKDGSTSIKVSIRKDGDGSDTTSTPDTSGIEAGSAAEHRLEILGVANLTRKHSGDEPVIQQLVYYDGTDHIGQTTATLLPDTRAVHGTPDYVFYLNGDDSACESAIINSKSASDDELLHLHPAPPAALSLTGGTTDMALRFGGESGAFEVPFSSEFLSFFETKVRNVIKSDWTLFIQTTPSATFDADNDLDRTLVHFGKLARIYYDSSADELLADINGSGESAPTTIGESGALDMTTGTQYDIALQRHSVADASDKNVFLYKTQTSNSTAEVANGKATQDTFLDLRRLYSVILGAQENQAAGTHWAGAVTKFAFYPFHTTRDAGKEGAIFYFDFSEGNYEDQANNLPYRRSFHSRSVQSPAFTQGSSIYTDGKAIGIGGGEVFTDSGPIGYTSMLTKPLGTDLHTQQAGRYVFFASGNYSYVADTKNKTARPLGLPEPGTDIQALPAGAGSLDGIFSYGYRFVSREGTAGPLRRLNPIHTFDEGGSSIIIGQPEQGDTGSGSTLERELGASHGMTENESSNDAWVSPGGPSFWHFWDPGENVGDMEIFRSPQGDTTTDSTSGTRTLGVDLRARSNQTGSTFESVFNRGITDELTFASQTRWAVIDKQGAKGPSMQENWMGQLCFRYKDNTGGHASVNDTHQVLFSMGDPDTQGQGGKWWGTDFFCSIIKDDSNLGGGLPRLVISRKTNQQNRWWDSQTLSSAPKWSGDGGHPGGTGVMQGDDTENATDGTATFWLDGHDYMVFVGREGDDLHVWAMDCTGVDFTGSDPITPNYDKCFWAKHADWWSGMPGPHNTTDRGLFMRFGSAAGPGQGDGSGDRCDRRSPKLDAAGDVTAATTYWQHHWWVPGTIFYHGRTWSTFSNPLTVLHAAWRRNAAKDEIKTAAGPDSGPLSTNIHNDIMGGTDNLFSNATRLYDRGRSGTAAAAVNFEIVHSNPDTHTDRFSDFPSKSGKQVRSFEVSGGAAEDIAPIFTIGDYGSGFEAQQLRFYMSSLFDGSIILDNASEDAYILARSFWRRDSQDRAPNMILLDDVPAIYQSGGQQDNYYDFGEPTWYSFIVDITDVPSQSKVLVAAKHLRINGNPNSDTTEGMFSLPLAPCDEPLTHANMVGGSSEGFIFLGGHPDLTAKDTFRLDELRIWEDDRWDKSKNRWFQGGIYAPQNLMTRLESTWAPEGDPEDSRKNHLIVYAKFQPLDTAANTGGIVGTNDDQLAHYGQWAYYDSDSNVYTGSREHHVLHVVTENDGAAGPPDTRFLSNYPGMVVDLGAGESGNEPPPGDTPPSLPIPAGPKHSVAAVEIFRTRAIGSSDYQEEDAGFVARMTEASRGAPLYRLARLPLHDRSFIDSVPDEQLGPEVDESHGAAPPDIVKGVFTWQDQLALISEGRSIYFAEPGPYGWESFPYWLTYQVPVDIAGGDVQAGAELGNGSAIVMGRTWAARLTGSPSSPDAVSLGGGVGAYDAHNLVTHAGAAFAFNGKLWAIAPNGSVTDIGRPVQGSLPAADQGRLTISSSLASLFLLNTSTGEACRYHFPTQQWTIEDRGALDMGDLAAGTDAWVSPQGIYALGDTTRVADFTHTATPSVGGYACAIATAASNTINRNGSAVWSSASTAVQVGAVVTAHKWIGNKHYYVTGMVSVLSGGTMTVDLGADTSGDTITLADYGFTDGMTNITVFVGNHTMVDTGPVYTPDETTLRGTDANVISGSGWYLSQSSTARATDTNERPVLDLTAIANNDAAPVASGTRGKFHRVIAWGSPKYEPQQLADIEIDIHENR